MPMDGMVTVTEQKRWLRCIKEKKEDDTLTHSLSLFLSINLKVNQNKYKEEKEEKKKSEHLFD